MTTSCELSLSVHSVFYLTRQPLHTLHKEMNIKILIVWGWRVERDVLKVQTNQLRFIVRSVSASSISPHLIEPFSSDGVACTDVPGLVHQPFQAEGLGHFHAGHCVPAHPRVNFSSQSSFHNNPPAVHLVGKEKDREPPCLDVWVLQKKLRSHLVHFQLRPTPGLPLSITMVST